MQKLYIVYHSFFSKNIGLRMSSDRLLDHHRPVPALVCHFDAFNRFLVYFVFIKFPYIQYDE